MTKFSIFAYSPSVNSRSLKVSQEPHYIGYPPAPCEAPDDNNYWEFVHLDPEHRQALEASGWGIIPTRQTPDGQEVQW